MYAKYGSNPLKGEENSGLTKRLTQDVPVQTPNARLLGHHQSKSLGPSELLLDLTPTHN